MGRGGGMERGNRKGKIKKRKMKGGGKKGGKRKGEIKKKEENKEKEK